jgi:hypothetical protein
MVRKKRPKWKVDDINMLVAAYGLAAGVFTDKDSASDVVSRIPMRISRTDEAMRKRAERDWADNPEKYSATDLKTPYPLPDSPKKARTDVVR